MPHPFPGLNPAGVICCLLPAVLLVVDAAHARPALEEVLVVAQRVEQSAQDTPVSLVALNRENLEVLGIGNIADIQANVPNFVVYSFPSSSQTLRLFISGVGINDVHITQDPAVGV